MAMRVTSVLELAKLVSEFFQAAAAAAGSGRVESFRVSPSSSWPLLAGSDAFAGAELERATSHLGTITMITPNEIRAAPRMLFQFRAMSRHFVPFRRVSIRRVASRRVEVGCHGFFCASRCPIGRAARTGKFNKVNKIGRRFKPRRGFKPRRALSQSVNAQTHLVARMCS